MWLAVYGCCWCCRIFLLYILNGGFFLLFPPIRVYSPVFRCSISFHLISHLTSQKESGPLAIFPPINLIRILVHNRYGMQINSDYPTCIVLLNLMASPVALATKSVYQKPTYSAVSSHLYVHIPMSNLFIQIAYFVEQKLRRIGDISSLHMIWFNAKCEKSFYHSVWGKCIFRDTQINMQLYEHAFMHVCVCAHCAHNVCAFDFEKAKVKWIKINDHK